MITFTIHLLLTGTMTTLSLTQRPRLAWWRTIELAALVPSVAILSLLFVTSSNIFFTAKVAVK